MDRFIDALCRLFGMLMVVALALMVVMVFGNVVLRYGFNSGITVSEELSRWLFVWMTFLGAIVALPPPRTWAPTRWCPAPAGAGKRICLVAAHLMMLYMCWLMAQGGWQQTRHQLGTPPAPSMEASMAWFFASGVLFAVLGRR